MKTTVLEQQLKKKKERNKCSGLELCLGIQPITSWAGPGFKDASCPRASLGEAHSIDISWQCC